MQEAVFSGDVVRKSNKRTDKIENTIESVDASVLELQSNFGVFWPEALWNAKHPESTAKKSELMSLPGHGKMDCQGNLGQANRGNRSCRCRAERCAIVELVAHILRCLWMMMRRTACGRRRRRVLRLGERVPALTHEMCIASPSV